MLRREQWCCHASPSVSRHATTSGGVRVCGYVGRWCCKKSEGSCDEYARKQACRTRARYQATNHASIRRRRQSRTCVGSKAIDTLLHAAALGCAALTPLSQPLDNQQETVVAATCTHSAVLWVCSGPQAAVMSPPHSFSRLLRKFVFENIQRLLSWPAHGVHPC
jgi:hypothetical protein